MYIRVHQLKASFVRAQNIAAIWNHCPPWQFWLNSLFILRGTKKPLICFSLHILFLQHRSRSAHLFNARDFSMLKHHHPLCLIGNLWVVGNNNNRTASVVQLFKNLHHQPLVFFIEVAGRFVRKQEFGMIDERTGNTYALLLSARQLIGQVLCPLL